MHLGYEDIKLNMKVYRKKTVVGEYLCGNLPFKHGLKNADGISTFGFQLLSSA
jgi:hypothetical protein